MSLSAIGLISSDIKRTILFYETLGLSFKSFSEEHFEAETPTGVRLMVDSEELIKKINPNWNKVINRQISLCFEQNSKDEVDQVYEKLVSIGADGIKEPWDAFWGQRYALVADPDGNQIDLFAAL